MSPRPFAGLVRPLIGMVHLRPLPGAPGYGGGMREVLERARRDARVLAEEGVDALLVENFGDRPFFKDRVPPETVAGLSVAAAVVQGAAPKLPIGVNCLRNDAHAALAVAAAVGARFVRVNVHAGAMLTDQGLVEGRAAQTLRERARLAPEVAIAADVHVKHASPVSPEPIARAARDAVERGLADALVVSGRATGESTDLEELALVRQAVEVPVLVGSGATHANVESLLDTADGIIVGTALQRGGRTGAPVEARRVARLVAAARRAR